MANNSNWKLTQLQKISEKDPLRVELMLDSLCETHPELLSELAISALEQGQISAQDCARMLKLSLEDVENKLQALRRSSESGRAVVVVSENRVAKLADGHVCVWEIVRELRRLGSLERVSEYFPALSRCELDAAVAYAEENSEEIEALIHKYELILERRRSEYPFACLNAS